jgi:ADP-ribose pyrophosphatase
MAADESINIETTSTRLVYENRWMRVREDTIRRRDGSIGIYGVVEKPDFVVIVPVEDDGRVHLVEQYRYPVKGPLLGTSPRLLGAGTGGEVIGS